MRKCSKCGERKALSFMVIKSGSWPDVCKACENKRTQTWRNSDHGRQLMREAKARYNEKLKREVLSYYSRGTFRCACKGCPERSKSLAFLCIDHKNGGGNKHRKEIGIDRLYRWLRANGYPKGFQVLCHNCNHAKHVLGRCPHVAKA